MSGNSWQSMPNSVKGRRETGKDGWIDGWMDWKEGGKK